ncbi:MAG TPA: DUF5063 domain-containing protein [Bacteroidales bacterium]|nr:DUF5063 domain-containing protein [Bacteroidales bacterium]HRZ76265.1 DUF5063 domain-containing protein [Bacteroidales bacterium]
MDTRDPVYSPHVLELLTVANEYCLFVERAADYPLDDFLDFLRKILPMLYLKGSLLPTLEPDEHRPERYVTEQQWESVFNDLRAKLGPLDDFYFIDLAEPGDTEPWKGSLSDNLADIYQDLKDFLLLYQMNTYTAQQNAVSECRQLFAPHWGERITRAQYPLHQLWARQQPEEPTDS